MKTTDLIDLAHSLGICIYWRPLEEGPRGLWDAHSRSIWIDSRLSDRSARSLLAHELGHATLGHHGPQSEARERDAWQWAAQTLIGSWDYARAEWEHGAHPGALAEALDVSVQVIYGYRATLERSLAA